MTKSFQVKRKRRDPHVGQRRAGKRGFTRNEIIDALRRWAREYDEPPRGVDLEPARARRLGQAWRADRFEAGNWPSARMIVRHFGSLSSALEAAGLEPRPVKARVTTNLAGPASIIDAIRQWTRRYGEVPTLADWDPARARVLGQDWRVGRYYDGDWPSARSVIARFGSMSDAVRAAGLPPRQVGSHGSSRLIERTRVRASLTAVLAAEQSTQPRRRDQLSTALRALAQARREQDPTAIHSALIDVATHALAWAEHPDADG